MKNFERLLDFEGRRVYKLPGIEITEMWQGMWQCVVQRTGKGPSYRFVDQGETPFRALANCVNQIIISRDNLNRDLEALLHVRDQCNEDVANSPQGSR